MYFKEFHVTGKRRDGKRFKRMKFSRLSIADTINIYQGSVWGVQENGKRKLIKRVYN